jgi:EmrB/QacA subfamily drug resistance transporter
VGAVPDDAPLPRSRRRLILAICCLSLFIVGIDVTIVNVALPAIRTDLHASVSQLQWTLDAYTLVLASLLVLGGSTADRFGRARVFRIGLATFSVGSLLCSIAPSAGLLIAARTLQAVGGSMLNPVAMSIIRNTFTDPAERARAIGLWGAVVGLSMALGPVVGGALVEGVGWRAVFWVNVPVGVAAFVLTARFVPESRAPHPRRFDPVGQVLVIVALATLVYGIIEGPTAGWGSPEIVGCFAAAVASVAGLIVYERRRTEPLIELRFFRSAPFSGATAIAVAAFAGFGGFLFLNTLYLQTVRGLSPLDAGLYTLPMAAATVVLSPLSGRLVGRVGSRPSLVAGGLGMTVGSAMLLGLSSSTSDAWLLTAYVIFGAGFGVLNPPITNTAVSGMPAAQAGVAAALASTSRQVGASLGVALVGVLAIPVGADAADLLDASHTGWAFLAGCGVAVTVLGLVTTGRWARATAARTLPDG